MSSRNYSLALAAVALVTVAPIMGIGEAAERALVQQTTSSVPNTASAPKLLASASSALGVASFVRSLREVASTRAVRVPPVRSRAGSVPEFVPSRMRVLRDNGDAFMARWDLVDGSEVSIDVGSYTFANELTTRAFFGKLLQKADDGVRVRLLLDAQGSTDLTRPWKNRTVLEALAAHPNIDVAIYNPKWRALGRLWRGITEIFSNHQKPLVVDGRYSIAGGRNYADEYYFSPLEDPHAVVDVDALIDSPAVAERLTALVNEEWHSGRAYVLQGARNPAEAELRAAARAVDALIAQQRHGHEVALDAQAAGYRTAFAKYERLTDAMVREPEFDEARTKLLVSTSGAGRRDEITPALIDLFRNAKHHITIENAYFVPTPELLFELGEAARRGVRVTVLTSGPVTSRNLAVKAAFMRRWREIFSAIPGLHLYGSRDTKTHSKVIAVDDEYAVVSSYNFDKLSQDLNGEDAFVFESPEVAKSLRETIEARAEQESRRYQLNVSGDSSLSYTPSKELREVEGVERFLIRALSYLTFIDRFV